MNTNKQVKAAGTLLGLAVMVAAARADVVTSDTVVQNFTFTTPLTAAGPAALPTINQLWNIQQWAGLPSDLQCVKLEVTNRLVYTGTLSSLLANQTFDLQVRSDFTLGLPGSVGSQTALDPVAITKASKPIRSSPSRVISAASTSSAQARRPSIMVTSSSDA